ncbi:937_t:CDS:2 [Gigaspora margarita]|uniref:937_t:CDS:1 n=1 Tax=Gigaspora margarita TaxID=4874 RepID=A0ABN7V5G6_GIGMA|nr:937_t:CDS:2 [Gigaspora margarita]
MPLLRYKKSIRSLYQDKKTFKILESYNDLGEYEEYEEYEEYKEEYEEYEPKYEKHEEYEEEKSSSVKRSTLKNRVAEFLRSKGVNYAEEQIIYNYIVEMLDHRNILF